MVALKRRATQLERTRVTQVYRRRLECGLRELRLFLFDRDSEIFDALQQNSVDFTLLDHYLAEWVNLCYEDKVPFWICKHGLLGLQAEFRHVRYKIPRAWDCVGSWDGRRTHSNRLPMNSQITEFLSSVALSWGLEQTSWALPLVVFSVLIRVGFNGLLRPGELLNLRSQDVSVSDVWDDHQYLVLAIRNPKTRRFGGRHQHVVIHDKFCIGWLRWLCRDLPPSMKIWPFSQDVFRTWFRKVLSRGGLQQFRFTPGSLRAGGTTHLVIQGMDLTRVQFLGRWRANSSMSVYVQEAMASLTWVHLSAELKHTISMTVLESRQLVSSPPLIPWWCLFQRPCSHESI